MVNVVTGQTLLYICFAHLGLFGIAANGVAVVAGSIPSSHWTQDPNIGGGRNLGEAIHMYDFCNFLTNDSEIISADVVSLDNRENYPSFS